MSANRSVLIFTGGHHSGALAVAQALRSEGIQILWIGHRRSMWKDKNDSAEYREVTHSGIPFYNLLAGKFYRSLHPLKLLRLPWGFIQAFALLVYFKIRFGRSVKGIFSSGGYLAVPVVICGWLLGIPAVTHEQTMAVGWANRTISRFAAKIALSWPSSQSNFPRSKSLVTGLPLRPEIARVVRHPQTKPPLILILGGKQGSHILNLAVLSALPELVKSYQVVHQLGSNSVYRDYQSALANQSPRYRPVEYLSPDQLAAYYSDCSLVVSRSGAHLVYELAHLGIPAVLVPIPWASHNEQQKNAQLLVDSGQAVLLPQSQLTASTLVSSISKSFQLKHGHISVPADGLDQVVQLIKHTLLNA